jgi:hypothetical protein
MLPATLQLPLCHDLLHEPLEELRSPNNTPMGLCVGVFLPLKMSPLIYKQLLQIQSGKVLCVKNMMPS